MKLSIIGCVAGILAVSSAASAGSLPPDWAGIVPQGYTLTASTYAPQAGVMTIIQINAQKKRPGHASVPLSEYRIDAHTQHMPKELVAMQAPGYRAQWESEIPRRIPKPASNVMVQKDAPVVTKYAWGTGITQKVVHHYIGAGNGKDDTEYVCLYLGLTFGGDAIKSFELTVSGADSAAEADAMAAKLAAQMAKSRD